VIDLPVADLYTHTNLFMPVQVINGRRPGPTLFVSAAVHGDELNGVEIIRRLLKQRRLSSLRGALIAVPIVNVHGFLDQSRYLPDRRDLNRSFPGRETGSIAARLAHSFSSQILAQSDCGIDLHTGALHRSNLPQVRANLADARTRAMAEAFGAPVIIDANLRDGSLREAAAQAGVSMLLYEAGEALRFDDVSIRGGLRGILNVMRLLEMLPPLKKSSAPRPPVVAEQTRWVRAPASGIVRLHVRLGARVKQGDRLATLSDPFGNSETEVAATFAGIVIGRINLPLAHEGDALLHIAAFESVRDAANTVEEFQAEFEPATEAPTSA
jgi:predicted deacylase